MEAPCYFSTHSIHAESILDTAKTRPKDNNIIERLEENLADSLELDKTVYLNSVAGLTLTEAFQNIKRFHRLTDQPTKMNSVETVFVDRWKLPMPAINISHLFSLPLATSVFTRALFHCHLLPQKRK